MVALHIFKRILNVTAVLNAYRTFMSLLLINSAFHLLGKHSDRKKLLIVFSPAGQHVRYNTCLLRNILILQKLVNQIAKFTGVILISFVFVIQKPPVLLLGKLLLHIRKHTFCPTDNFLKIQPQPSRSAIHARAFSR